MKGVEEVKYMRGEENRVNARNQENLVRHAHTHQSVTPTQTAPQIKRGRQAGVPRQLHQPRHHAHTHTHVSFHAAARQPASQAGRDNLLARVECGVVIARSTPSFKTP